MTLRLQNITKWMWCLIFLHMQPWLGVKAIFVKGPPNPPSTVEAQAKFFQDFFSVQLSPYKMEFGHVCEDPNTWEQRYEKKDFKNHRDMGKVRWGDKKGGYGEHYWDLNHAGHNNDHSDDGNDSNTDDGSYNPQEHEDPYDEPSDHSPKYEGDYNPDYASVYDDSNRAKRAYHNRRHEGDSSQRVHKSKPNQKNKQEKIDESNEEHKKNIPEHSHKNPRKTNKQYRPVQKEQDYEEDDEQKVITLKDLEEKDKSKRFEKTDKLVSQENSNVQPPEYATYEKQGESDQFPSYDNARVSQQDQFQVHEGAGERHPENFTPHDIARTRQSNQQAYYEGVQQHHSLQPVSPSRLYLQAATGHVIDRATGQAYVLQPVSLAQNHFN